VDARGDAVAFGLATGGVLCPECRPGQPHVATLSGRTLDAIRVLASPGRAWRDLDPAPALLAPVRATLGAVLSHLLGHRPRLLPYLGA
jgi:DNA repair protein RecO (recombination protein O)